MNIKKKSLCSVVNSANQGKKRIYDLNNISRYVPKNLSSVTSNLSILIVKYKIIQPSVQNYKNKQLNIKKLSKNFSKDLTWRMNFHLPFPAFENIPSRRISGFPVSPRKAVQYSPLISVVYYVSGRKLHIPEDFVLHPDWQPFWLLLWIPKNQMSERQCFTVAKIHGIRTWTDDL